MLNAPTTEQYRAKSQNEVERRLKKEGAMKSVNNGRQVVAWDEDDNSPQIYPSRRQHLVGSRGFRNPEGV